MFLLEFSVEPLRDRLDKELVGAARMLLWNELSDVPCAEFPLTRGDRWLFFTDGITDRQAPDGTMFDLDRLAPALARSCNKTPVAIVDAIVSELDSFSGGVEPEDDQTLLVVGFD